MKKWMAVWVVVMMAVPALAQFMGLPMAGGAAAPGAGAAGISAGAVVGDDFNLYGGRASFAPVAGLTVFGGAGVIDPDGDADMGWALQGGGLFTLPLGLPVDVGLRGTFGMAGFDMDGGELSMWDITGGVLASKTIERLTPYAFLGVHHVDMTVDIDGGGEASEDETDLAVAGGVSFALNKQFSVYAEIAHIDDPFFGGGVRMNF